MRRLAGIGALAYFLGVAIENQEILTSPTLDSSVESIRANYSDHAFNVVTGVAGALAQVAFVLFAVALVTWLRGQRGADEPWPTLALAGGIASPAIAAAGLAAGAPVLADPAGVTDDVLGALFDIDILAQFVAAPFLSLFLAGVGISALRSGALPRWLAWFAVATAVPLLLAPIAVFQRDSGLEFLVKLCFAANAVWVLLVGMWLLLDDGGPLLAFVRRGAFLLVAIAAGAIGVALLLAPGGTGHFFAWPLGPEPLGALAGGLYVGAAATYALALPASAREARGLVLGGAVLAVTVLIVSLTDTDQFDFDRLQAIMWFAFFGAFSLGMIALFILDPGVTARRRSQLTPWARVGFVGFGGLAAATALWLWINPSGLSTPLPIELPDFGGRFLGCWLAFLAVVCGWAAHRNRADEAHFPALLLVFLPAGALIGALRIIEQLEPRREAALYIVVLGLVVVAAIAVLESVWPLPNRGAARSGSGGSKAKRGSSRSKPARRR